ncbi:MAG: hypothetical protein IPJ67_01005 [Candidatus Moraniibacteriota bacterium]|nr:MAG: hypothetical protein IPJ67_01005 [Candidatus Moranbacteria bacterium]
MNAEKIVMNVQRYVGRLEEAILVMLLSRGVGEWVNVGRISKHLQDTMGIRATIGSVHSTLARLEMKSLVKTRLESMQEYSGRRLKKPTGRRRKMIQITPAGRNMTILVRECTDRIWGSQED